MALRLQLTDNEKENVTTPSSPPLDLTTASADHSRFCLHFTRFPLNKDTNNQNCLLGVHTSLPSFTERGCFLNSPLKRCWLTALSFQAGGWVRKSSDAGSTTAPTLTGPERDEKACPEADGGALRGPPIHRVRALLTVLASVSPCGEGVQRQPASVPSKGRAAASALCSHQTPGRTPARQGSGARGQVTTDPLSPGRVLETAGGTA